MPFYPCAHPTKTKNYWKLLYSLFGCWYILSAIIDGINEILYYGDVSVLKLTNGLTIAKFIIDLGLILALMYMFTTLWLIFFR